MAAFVAEQVDLAYWEQEACTAGLVVGEKSHDSRILK